MERVTFSPARLCGTVQAPPSKSDAHRAILCAALARGVSVLAPIAFSEDIKATVRCVQALGARVTVQGDTLIVDGSGLFTARSAQLDCGESGSTLRFLIPIAAAGGVRATFLGRGRLPQRPIGCYLTCLPAAGVACKTQGGLPLSIDGRLRGGVFSLPGNVSSQFITGLLLALPLLEEDSEIRLTTPLESAAYVDMTLCTMRAFGVAAEPIPGGWRVPGGQAYRPCRYTIEGDWSQAAFYLAAGLLGGALSITGLRRDSLQGDRACEQLFADMGAQICWKGDALSAAPGCRRAAAIDASQIPDLVPVLAAAAAFCEGETVIFGAGRLRMKESDRLAAVAAGLRALGGDVAELPEGLRIHGRAALPGGDCDGAGDHRIVMALAIAALACTGTVSVSQPESVKKSYPEFFKEYRRLGGMTDVVDLGE